uniref:Uncharacterized protein n=1 Tax=Physcomitrium patens TaxID=3218 RepID=A0A7I4ET95_PHYPA
MLESRRNCSLVGTVFSRLCMWACAAAGNRSFGRQNLLKAVFGERYGALENSHLCQAFTKFEIGFQVTLG